jgi:hypothetical protein
MIRFIFSVILMFGLAACDHPKKPRLIPPTTPAPAPTPSEDTQPSPSSSMPVKPALKTYSQTMYDQQHESLAANALDSDAGVAGQSSFSAYYSAMWCAHGVDCRAHFVMVTSSIGTCSGVLVAPRVVLTNRHCVEDLASEPNAPFKGNISVVSPQSREKKGDMEFNYAVNLIAISPTKFMTDDVKPDYAFLLLWEPFKTIKPVKMNFGGLIDGETYSLYGVSPYGGKDANAVEKRECVAKYNTTVAPNFDSPKDANFKFADCPIGPSNSGSPVFNKNDELVGLMGGQLGPQTVNALNIMALLELHLTNPSNPLGHVGWGTNLTCMPDIRDLSKPIPAECDHDFSSPKLFATVAPQIENRVIGELGRFPKTEGDFDFGVMRAAESKHIVKLLSQALYLRVPECIHPTALKDKIGPQDVDMKIQTTGLAMNKFWELTDKIVGPTEKDFHIHYDASELKTKGFTDMSVSLRRDIRIHTSVLKVCKAL